MIFSKMFADSIRLNVKKESKIYTALYVIACMVRVLEIVAIALIAWIVLCTFLLAGQ